MGAAIAVAPVFLLFGMLSGHLAMTSSPQLEANHLLWMLVIYPVSEEIIFRGGVQGAIARLPWGRYGLAGISLSNFLASLIFSLLHVWNLGDWWAIAVFLPSLIYGLSYELTGKLLAPISLHSWYNLVGLFWVWP